MTDGVAAFKGIPFAAPPFGPDRFQPPQPVQPWSGIRSALVYGEVPPQSPYLEPFYALLGDNGFVGEDCLNLNVWTPDPGGGGLPVMVWIHGGSFFRGSGAVPAYDGTAFARDGVVCVTINYRLGAEGFLWFGSGPANLGLLDQLAALRWVQENIRAFGGDPARVTVFGESAGAFSIATLLAIDASRGLFSRAILESGAAHHVITPATADQVGRLLCEKLGIAPSREALAAVPIDRYVRAQAELNLERELTRDPARFGETVANGMLFEPVVDGTLLRSRPIDAIAAGARAGVQLLAGNTTEDYRFFIVPNGLIDHMTDGHLTAIAARHALTPGDAIPVYRAAYPGAIPGDLLSAVMTDWFFRIPALRVAETVQARGDAAYVYEFAWRSPLFGGRLGACHALEIAFVFDNLDPKASPMLGKDPPPALATAMHSAWVRFASTGDPGWPRYEPGRRPVMRFDEAGGTVVDDPGGTTRRLWDGIR
jgi:para-nitrobenzyl esterase